MQIKFPNWVAPPTPCITRTYSVVEHDVHHGAIINHVTVLPTETWVDAVIVGLGDWIAA